jgi:hypothetical protein
MRPTLIAIAIVSMSTLHAQPSWPTLAEIVEKLGTSPAGLPRELLAKRITSYATMAQDGEFGVAGWEFHSTGRLTPPLYVALRERGREWRSVELFEPTANETFGTVLRMSSTGGRVIIDTSLTPSAGAMIVLRKDLTYLTRLSGWSLMSVPEGPVVFHRSMVHFAQAHPGELATYDPRTGTESRLYPTDTASPLRQEFIERLRPIYEQWEKREPGYVYGFNPKMFDVSFSDLRYEENTDMLTVPTVFTAGRHPPELGPPQVLKIVVRCAPMRSRSRTCTEARDASNSRNY